MKMTEIRREPRMNPVPGLNEGETKLSRRGYMEKGGRDEFTVYVFEYLSFRPSLRDGQAERSALSSSSRASVFERLLSTYLEDERCRG